MTNTLIRSLFQKNLRIFLGLSLTLFIFLSFFYIFQINKITTESFLISNFENKVADLSQQNKVLEISFFKNNSLENVESFVRNSNFEKIGEIHYIRVLESTVVTK